MRSWSKAILAAAALASCAAPAFAQGDEASVEKRLADAQRRLEAAAREVAELSGEAAGPGGPRQFEYFLGGPRRAMLGVNIDGSEPNGGGVRVGNVSPGGPAAEAGVKAGDVIVSVQSKPVATGRELVRVMETVKPGEKVELGLKRDGKPLKLAVEARPVDNLLFAAAPGVPAIPSIPALPPLPAIAAFAGDGDLHWLLEDWGDAEFVTMTPGLGRYFGADRGVLVARAPEDASLGLKDGDVIVAIGGREPQDSRHAMRILRSYQPGESVELRILRDHRAQTLTAKIPERDQRDVMRRALPPPPAPPAPRAPAPPAPEESASAT
jgi:membrane-associated protease RseP (regulator of RpoE activity)